MPLFLYEYAMKKLLLCIDGEEQTLPAMRKALDIAGTMSAEVWGLHVVSPYLKKFTTEIYAVGRNECCDHLDASLEKEGQEALRQFVDICAAGNVTCKTVIRYGEIAGEIIAEAESGGYEMVILGAKELKTFLKRLESVNVPMDVFKRCKIPMLFVRP